MQLLWRLNELLYGKHEHIWAQCKHYEALKHNINFTFTWLFAVTNSCRWTLAAIKLRRKRQFNDGKMFRTYAKWRENVSTKQPFQYDPNFVKYIQVSFWCFSFRMVCKQFVCSRNPTNFEFWSFLGLIISGTILSCDAGQRPASHVIVRVNNGYSTM